MSGFEEDKQVAAAAPIAAEASVRVGQENAPQVHHCTAFPQHQPIHCFLFRLARGGGEHVANEEFVGKSRRSGPDQNS